MRVWLVTEWRERRQRRREWEAEGKARDERHEALMESAVVLAVEEARSEALPGMRPRVDIEDVVAVLDRPGFDFSEGPLRVVGGKKPRPRGAPLNNPPCRPIRGGVASSPRTAARCYVCDGSHECAECEPCEG